MLVRRVGLARRVAVLEREGRASLPKALLGAGEDVEGAARRAGEGWLGRAVRVEAPLGRAEIELDGRVLLVSYFAARVAAGARTLRAEGWTLFWREPAAAAEALAQREERELLRRILRTERASLARRLAPRNARAGWLAAGLVASAALAPLAAALGWLTGAPFAPEHVKRLALAAACGGLTSAAARMRPGESPLLGAAAGTFTGTWVALLLASGAVPALALDATGAIALAWLGAFLERPLMRAFAPRAMR